MLWLSVLCVLILGPLQYRRLQLHELVVEVARNVFGEWASEPAYGTSLGKWLPRVLSERISVVKATDEQCSNRMSSNQACVALGADQANREDRMGPFLSWADGLLKTHDSTVAIEVGLKPKDGNWERRWIGYGQSDPPHAAPSAAVQVVGRRLSLAVEVAKVNPLGVQQGEMPLRLGDAISRSRDSFTSLPSLPRDYDERDPANDGQHPVGADLGLIPVWRLLLGAALIGCIAALSKRVSGWWWVVLACALSFFGFALLLSGHK